LGLCVDNPKEKKNLTGMLFADQLYFIIWRGHFEVH